jgi:hypothetical protein
MLLGRLLLLLLGWHSLAFTCLDSLLLLLLGLLGLLLVGLESLQEQLLLGQHCPQQLLLLLLLGQHGPQLCLLLLMLLGRLSLTAAEGYHGYQHMICTHKHVNMPARINALGSEHLRPTQCALAYLLAARAAMSSIMFLRGSDSR